MSPASPTAPRERLEHGIAACCLTLALVLMVLSSLHKRLSNDEWFNLDYGREFLSKGSGAAVSPHLPGLALNALPCLASGCDRLRLDTHGGERLLVRGPTIVLTLLLGGLLYVWTRQLLGGPAALLALVLYVFNPNVLAHGKEVTGDLPTSFFSFLAAFGAFRAVTGGRLRDLVLAALGLSGAALTKYTSLVLIPVLLLAALLRRPRLERARLLKGGGLVLVLFVCFVSLPYGFHGFGSLASSLPFESRALSRWAPGLLPIPLPRSYVMGFDFLLVFQDQPTLQRGMNYALGHLSYAPIWYAFPLMFLLKTPLAFLVLLGMGLVRGRLPSGATPFVVLPALAFLLLFSLFVGPQMGVRYLLPAFPFLTILGAWALSDSPRRKAVVGLLAGWNVVSTLSYHPFYMCYFNELIGRRVNAYRYLADSNLDWEDRAYFIARFEREHPALEIAVDPPEPRPGYVLVSANKLVGIIDRRRYRWLRGHFDPVGHVGYSYLLFDVPPERLAEVLKEKRLSEP